MGQVGHAILEPFRWYAIVLRRYATFDGRARRREFWWFMLVNFVAGNVATAVDHLVHTPTTQPLHGYWMDWTVGGGILSHVYGLATLVPTLAVCWRRMHDTNRSGKVTLIVLAAPVLLVIGLALGPIAAIVLSFLPTLFVAVLAAQNGTTGDNRYGHDPKAPSTSVDRPGPSPRAEAPQVKIQP